MFAEPNVNDHLNQVRLAIERGRKRFNGEVTRVKTEFAKAGSGGSRMFVYIAEALNAEFDTTVRDVLGELRRSLKMIKGEDPKTLRSLTGQELMNFVTELRATSRRLCHRPHRPSEQTSAEALLLPAADALGQRLSLMIRQFDIGFLDNVEPEAVSVTHNNLNVGTNIGAIQQGSHGATQNVNVSLDVGAVTIALDAFEKELATSPLQTETRQALGAEIETARAQLKKAAPSKPILAEVGRSIRNVVEGVAAGMMTPQAIAAATALATALGV